MKQFLYEMIYAKFEIFESIHTLLIIMSETDLVIANMVYI